VAPSTRGRAHLEVNYALDNPGCFAGFVAAGDARRCRRQFDSLVARCCGDSVDL
jgi:hypothetical protein